MRDPACGQCVSGAPGDEVMLVSGTQEHPRVRPHVARAVERARAVILDFDGVMFNVQDALGRDARSEAVIALLADREHRPRPSTFVRFGFDQTLAYVAEHEPDHAGEAEALVSTLERDAALTAVPAYRGAVRVPTIRRASSYVPNVNSYRIPSVTPAARSLAGPHRTRVHAR